MPGGKPAAAIGGIGLHAGYSRRGKGWATVTEVVNFPLEDGGTLTVQAAGADMASGLDLASVEDRLMRSGETLESALGKVTPGLKAVVTRLQKLSPDGMSVEFGLSVTAETGVVVAKGSAEVHFTVTLTWGGQHEAPNG
jgi:hypothetical protein